ncbi:DUF7547 family protein [Halocatena salina]|uniref:Uncharacterized protein n=1 Tax=Halocatena salina TaxID=2934340 RepID=A0A8U0A0W4_9EURY|nr:hypothetical protein [Halocatena salina]UPM42760.1 hypothetical protein MW046_12475 [Halocatena salina]
MDRQDEDLEELLVELSTTLSELQDTLADEHQPQSRRLPSPGRFLRFTEEHTIPTLISLLETHIRALELLQGLLGLVNGREQREASQQRGDRRVQETGRRTLDALDGALSDLQGALHGEPSNEDARALLNDARTLSEEIDERLTNPTETTEKNGTEKTTDDSASADGAIRIDVNEPDTDPDSEEEISVDEELDTIKRELDDDEDDDTD